jgi:hypothetical protein
MITTTTVNGSRGQAPAAVIAKAKPPKEPRRQPATRRQPSAATAPVPSVASQPKPLEGLMQEYQSTHRVCNATLVELGKHEHSMSEADWIAATGAATAPLGAAREAMIDAPVATLADIALKLRFYFEVGDYSWGDRIVKNILRDIDKLSEEPRAAQKAETPAEATVHPMQAAPVRGSLHSLLWEKIDDISATLTYDEIANSLLADTVEAMWNLTGQAPNLSHYLDRLNLVIHEQAARTSEIDRLTEELREDIKPLDAMALGARGIDPVLALWDRVNNTEAAFNKSSEDDEAAHEAAEKEMSDAAEEFVSTKPTTALGIALKLKYLARVESHEKQEYAGSHEVRIVRDLVRQLTGDPNWTSEQEG